MVGTRAKSNARIASSRLGKKLCCCIAVGLATDISLSCPAWAQSSPAVAADLSAQPLFLVSSTQPYQLAPHSAPNYSSLTAQQIASLAAQNNGATKLLSSDLRSRLANASSCLNSESTSAILKIFEQGVGTRLRQTAVANALKIHYGLAACLHIERLLDENEKLLQAQRQAMNAIADKGIPIPDPILIDRLTKSLNDKRLENQSRINVLHAQLAWLIGPECACQHAPYEPLEVVPSDVDVCDYITQAMQCRCDLVSLYRLRGKISEDTLGVWDAIGASLAGAPNIATQSSKWISLVGLVHRRKAQQSAISARYRWMDELIAERSKQITSEVEVAFEKKRTAALRWVNTRDLLADWDTRIAQLEKLGDVQGNLAAQFEAKLQRLADRATWIERWSEWHLANIDLQLAVGCEMQ